MAVRVWKELGFDIVYSVTRGLMVPKGTPADILAKLEGACAKATAESAFAKAMAKPGTAIRFMEMRP